MNSEKNPTFSGYKETSSQKMVQRTQIWVLETTLVESRWRNINSRPRPPTQLDRSAQPTGPGVAPRGSKQEKQRQDGPRAPTWRRVHRPPWPLAAVRATWSPGGSESRGRRAGQGPISESQISRTSAPDSQPLGGQAPGAPPPPLPKPYPPWRWSESPGVP